MESHRFRASDGVELRYLTAGTSGSWAGPCGAGLIELDEARRAAAAALDPAPPDGLPAPLFPTIEALTAVLDIDVDLRSVDIPILCINGEYDRPYSKTQRLWREARTFQNVVLRGCDHLAACGVGSPIPEEYVAATAGFIAMYDTA